MRRDEEMLERTGRLPCTHGKGVDQQAVCSYQSEELPGQLGGGMCPSLRRW